MSLHVFVTGATGYIGGRLVSHLLDAGYRVRVVSVNHTAWAADADRAARATRAWAWTVVDYSRATARAAQILTGARRRAAWTAARIGPARVPMAIAVRATSRAHT